MLYTGNLLVSTFTQQNYLFTGIPSIFHAGYGNINQYFVSRNGYVRGKVSGWLQFMYIIIGMYACFALLAKYFTVQHMRAGDITH